MTNGVQVDAHTNHILTPIFTANARSQVYTSSRLSNCKSLMSDEQKPTPQPQSIDWRSIWKQLDWDETRQQDEIETRLHLRARQYAQPLKQDKAAEHAAFTVLTFNLGVEKYAVDVMTVQMVRPLPPLTRVPGTPDFYPGVVNISGQIVTVLDLRHYFDMDTDETEPARELVIVESSGLKLGLLAHHIEGVLTLSRDTIEPTEDMRYAFGVTEQRLVVLDIARLLEDKRLMIGDDRI